MRHVRKLLLTTVLACALSGAMASGASAAVEVSNGGPFEIQGSLAVDSSAPGIAWGVCNLQLTAEASSDGHVTLSNIAFIGGEWAYCHDTWACYGEPWEGQIVGPGDEGYIGVGDFELLAEVCIAGLGTSKPLRIALDEVSGGELWTVHRQQIADLPLEWIANGNGTWAGYSEFGIASVEE